MLAINRSLTFVVASLSLFACAASAEPDESSNESAPAESTESTDQASVPGLHSTQKVIYGGNNCWCHSGYYTCGVLGTSTCCDRYACMTATGIVLTSSPQN